MEYNQTLEVFRPDPSAFAIARKRQLLIGLPLGFLITVPCGFIWIANSHSSGWSQVIPVILFAAVMQVLSTYRILDKQKKALDNFVFSIDNDSITCTTLLQQEVNLTRLEIIEIIKNIDGSFMVRGGINNNVITIPAQIERKDVLERKLNELAPVVIAEKSTSEKYKKLFGFLMVALFIAFYISDNTTFICIAGPALAIAFGYTFVRAQMNKHIDSKQKKKMWLMVLIIIIVIARTALVLTAHN